MRLFKIFMRDFQVLMSVFKFIVCFFDCFGLLQLFCGCPFPFFLDQSLSLNPVCREYKPSKKQKIEQVGKGGPPPGRQDFERNFRSHTVIRKRTSAGGGLHLKLIFSKREVGKKDAALCPQINPFIFIAQQAVSIPGITGSIINSRKTEREVIIIIFNLNIFVRIQMGVACGSRPELIDKKFLNVWLFTNLRRVKLNIPATSSNDDIATRKLCCALIPAWFAIHIEQKGLFALCIGIYFTDGGPNITGPNVPLLIFQYGAKRIIFCYRFGKDKGACACNHILF